MEPIYDISMRFKLLEAQFNEKLEAQEARITQLENTNIKLVKANKELESKLKKTSWDFEELDSRLQSQTSQLIQMNDSLETKFTIQLEDTIAKLQRDQDEIYDWIKLKNLRLDEDISTLKNQIVRLKGEKNPLVLIGFKSEYCNQTQKKFEVIPIFASKKSIDFHNYPSTTIIMESLLELNIKELNLPLAFTFVFNDNIDYSYKIVHEQSSGCTFIHHNNPWNINLDSVKRIFEFCDKHNINVLLNGSNKYQGIRLRDWIKEE